MMILLITNARFQLALGEMELVWHHWRLGYVDLYVEQEAEPRARE
jgi:hypothetical protein